MIPFEGKLLFANVDAEKVLLGTKNDNRPKNWWPVAFEKARVFLDKNEALEFCLKSNDEACLACVEKALQDDFWKIRHSALKGAKKLNDKAQLKTLLESMVKNDPKSLVRAKAIKTLHKVIKDEDITDLLNIALNDRSYAVMSEALETLVDKDLAQGLSKALELEQENSSKIKGSIANIYAKHGDESKNEFMLSNLNSASGFEKYGLTGSYTKYLLNQSSEFIGQNLNILESIASNESTWWVRLMGYNGLKSIENELNERPIEDTFASELAASIPLKIKSLLESESNEQLKAIINP